MASRRTRNTACLGKKTRAYLSSTRLIRPAFDKRVIAEIIIGGGEKLLSPERRFDATVYFTAHAIFETWKAAEEATVETVKKKSRNAVPLQIFDAPIFSQDGLCKEVRL